VASGGLIAAQLGRAKFSFFCATGFVTFDESRGLSSTRFILIMQSLWLWRMGFPVHVLIFLDYGFSSVWSRIQEARKTKNRSRNKMVSLGSELPLVHFFPFGLRGFLCVLYAWVGISVVQNERSKERHVLSIFLEMDFPRIIFEKIAYDVALASAEVSTSRLVCCPYGLQKKVLPCFPPFFPLFPTFLSFLPPLCPQLPLFPAPFVFSSKRIQNR
jgi:hypothetical protein